MHDEDASCSHDRWRTGFCQGYTEQEPITHVPQLTSGVPGGTRTIDVCYTPTGPESNQVIQSNRIGLDWTSYADASQLITLHQSNP